MPKKKEPKAIYPQFDGLGLNPKQQDFVYYYCHPDYCYNGTRAYAKAYGLTDIEDYMTAAVNASKLLKNTKVMDALDIERKRRLRNHEKLAEKIIDRLDRIASVDPFEFINIVGPIVMVKDISEIPQHIRPAVKSVKTTSNGVEVTFHDPVKANELLGKAIGMFVEKVQNVNEEYESIVQRIDKERRETKSQNIQDGGT